MHQDPDKSHNNGMPRLKQHSVASPQQLLSDRPYGGVYQDHTMQLGPKSLEPQTLATDSSDMMIMLADTGVNAVEAELRNKSIEMQQHDEQHKHTMMIEEQQMMQASEQIHQQMPLTHVSIGTNDESSGIFDYYRRSISETGAYNAAGCSKDNNYTDQPQVDSKLTNKNNPYQQQQAKPQTIRPYISPQQQYQQPQSNQQQYNHKESSSISVPVNNGFSVSHVQQIQCSTQPAIDRNSIGDNSAMNMFDSTLLAERNTHGINESLDQTYENQQHSQQEQSRLSNHQNLEPPLHSVSLNQNLPSRQQNHNTRQMTPEIFGGHHAYHNAYTNLNLTQNSSYTADNNRRKQHRGNRTRPILLSPQIKPEPNNVNLIGHIQERETRHQNHNNNQRAKSLMRQNWRHRENLAADISVPQQTSYSRNQHHQISSQYDEELQMAQQQHQQQQVMMLNANHQAQISMPEVMPSQDIDDYSVHQQQMLQQNNNLHQQQQMQQNQQMQHQQNLQSQQNHHHYQVPQISASSGQETVSNQLTFSTTTNDLGRPPISSKPLSMSLLNTSNMQAAASSGKNVYQSYVGQQYNPHPPDPQKLQQQKQIHQILEQSRTTRAGTDYQNLASQGSGPITAQVSHHEQTSSFGGNELYQQYPQLNSIESRTNAQQVSYRHPQHQVVYEYPQAQQQLVHPPVIGSRHRSLDAPVAQREPLKRIASHTIDAMNDNRIKLPAPGQMTIEDNYYGDIKADPRSSRTVATSLQNTQDFNQATIQTPQQSNYNHQGINQPNVVHVAVLQQEKGQLIQEVVSLNDHVSTLEHQKLKLRKSKKKLRTQLDSVKNQLKESLQNCQYQSGETEATKHQRQQSQANNNLLELAVVDLRSKIEEMKEASSVQNDMHVRALQTTMDALYKNLVNTNGSAINTDRDHMASHTCITNNTQNYTANQQQPSRPTLQTERLQQEKSTLEVNRKSRENLTTEFEQRTDQSSRSHLIREAQQEYIAVLQQSEEESGEQQNVHTQISSESEQNKPLPQQKVKRQAPPKPKLYSKQQQTTEAFYSTQNVTQDLKDEVQGLNKEISGLNEEMRSVKEENDRLKTQLSETVKVMEEQARLKDSETADILQKYQSAVQKMHGRLKEVALRFDEGEKTRQAKLRKARKEMEVELHRLTEMNEQLFQSCQKFQEKLIEQVQISNQFKDAHYELEQERLRQGGHIQQLVNINKGQIALIENMKQRIGFGDINQQQQQRLILQPSEQPMSGRRMRRSRSSSVHIKDSASLRQAFESESKIHGLFTLQDPDPYQLMTMPPRRDHQNIHEVSEELKSSERQGYIKREDGTDTIAVSTIQHNQQREMTTIEALVDGAGHESRTYESQQIRGSYLEIQRSSMNHESHHDQHDYDSLHNRTKIANEIPQLSPFLMSQLQKRLELENKIQDHKQYLSQHQKTVGDRQKLEQVVSPIHSKIHPINMATSPSMMSGHVQEIIFPTMQSQIMQDDPSKHQQPVQKQNKDMKGSTPFAEQDKVNNATSKATVDLSSKFKQNRGDHKRDEHHANSDSHQAFQKHLMPAASNEEVKQLIFSEGFPSSTLNTQSDERHGTNKDQTRSVEGDSKQQIQAAMIKHNTVSFKQNSSQKQMQTTESMQKMHILNEALFTRQTSLAAQSLKQEPKISGEGSDNKMQVKQKAQSQGRGAEFWNLKQLVSLDSSILTEAHSSLNQSLLREKHEKMSKNYEQLQGSQEVLLTKIKDEIGNLDSEIIVLQKNLSQAINKRN